MPSPGILSHVPLGNTGRGVRKGGMEVTDASKFSLKANCLCGAPKLGPSEEQGRIFLRVIATLENNPPTPSLVEC